MKNEIKYEVRTLDVWGNDQDGYEVNDSFSVGYIYLEEGFSNKDVLNELENENFLCSFNGSLEGYLEKCSFNGDDTYIEIDLDGKPLFNLLKEEEDSFNDVGV